MEYVIEVLMAEKHRLSILREKLVLADKEGGNYDVAYHKIREIEKTIEKLQELPKLLTYTWALRGMDYECQCGGSSVGEDSKIHPSWDDPDLHWWNDEGKNIFK